MPIASTSVFGFHCHLLPLSLLIINATLISHQMIASALIYRVVGAFGFTGFASPRQIDEVRKAERRERRAIRMVLNLRLKIGHARFQDHPH